MTDKVTLDVIRGFQGNMIAYQGHLSAKLIQEFLGHDPRSRNAHELPEELKTLYTLAQRTTKAARIDHLESYIEGRVIGTGVVPGALPAVSVGFISPLTFIPVKGYDNVGTIQISRTSLWRMVFDGRGRLSTILDMLAKGTRGIAKLDIPVTIFCSKRGRLSSDEFGQLFYDFNMMGSKVTAAQARGKDVASAHSQLGRWMMTLPAFSSLTSTNNTFTEEKMVRFVRASVENVAASIATNKRLTGPTVLDGSNVADFKAAFEVFWERLYLKAGPSAFESNEDSVMPFQHCYGAIASILYKLAPGQLHRVSRQDLERFADAFAAINWNKKNPEWKGVLVNTFGDSLKVGGGGSGIPVLNMIYAKVTSHLAKSR